MSSRGIRARRLLGLLVLCLTTGGVWGQQPETLPPPRPMPLPPPPSGVAAPVMPPWLPRYDLDMQLDLLHHEAVVRQRVTWTNRHKRPAGELVFNAHSHYVVPGDEVGLMAKTLEIMRMMPSDCLYGNEAPLEVRKVTLGNLDLPFHYQEDNGTALVAVLPHPVGQGKTVTITIDFVFHIPEKQGRWSCWRGVTTLSNWLPVLAVYDEVGWHPTPFIPWHQPFFNEAGVYQVRVTLPADQKIATSGWVVGSQDLVNGQKRVDILAPGVRDFAFLCSARYCEYAAQVGPVRVRCMAFPEHEHYAKQIVKTASEVLPHYSSWFGPYPWPELTFSESYFGWNGNECATLVMIDERVFTMPQFADGYVEYLIAHETCHQWWYNLLGTNGYCETWMDEAFANYFAHRFMNQKHSKNNNLLSYPPGFEWLPNIKRENYRCYELYGTLGRGEGMKVVQDMPEFKHVINLFSMCYDKGGKIIGMIEDRLGESAFIDFMHIIYQRYQYRIIRVADFQHELEEYTGRRWDDFFDNWLYGTKLTDWSIEKVTLAPQDDTHGDKGNHGWSFLASLHAGQEDKRPHKVTVILHQKAEYNEQTVLGFCLDGGTGYQIRIPILPQAPVLQLDEPPARIEMLPENRVRVEVLLPCKPTQIAVDPDQVLVDPDPSNNFWKAPVRLRFTPLYTFIEESSLTCDYDRWNVIAGPWLYGSAYNDPWYTRSSMAGARVGLFRTEHFSGGAYAAYRSDFQDVVVGADGVWDHWPFPKTQVGFNVEHRIAQISEEQPNVNRAAVFGRYVFQYADSLYLPPMSYLEVFADYADNFLPFERHALPGATRFDTTSLAGIHYNLNYLTPYWDPEGGIQVDATYAGGVVDGDKHEGLHLLHGQLATTRYLPDLSGWLTPFPTLDAVAGPPLRWLADTRLAVRAFGAAGLPNKGEYFTLGGSDMFRGYDLRERQGSVVWLSNVEWRVPLAKRLSWDLCDHVVGARNIYAAAFYDVGDAYVHGRSYGPVAHALGLGLRVDTTFLSLVEHATMRLDVAKTINSDTGVQVWFGFQQPF